MGGYDDHEDSDAHQFDQFLMKLETTKQQPSRSMKHVDSCDNSTFDSRNESAFDDMITESEDNERQLFETRQSFVDRRVGSPRSNQDFAVDSFIERTQSGQSSYDRYNSPGEERLQLVNRNSDKFYEEGLPDAILKLDRRHAIPTPRHKNDILIEIEACSVDRRSMMVRPGVRCTESLPQGVETTGVDCIGRVVQLTTHARAVYGISIDDRVGCLYPFEYKDGYKGKGRKNRRYALVDAGFVVTVPKHVDAAEASCMIRLYLSAFQSISLGVSSLQNRYGFNQLAGQSVLIENGTTELGRALIDLCAFLGASRIFATGSTEDHSFLKGLGAIPLGAESFGWELFLEEKLSLVLVQNEPTADNFEQFISILDDSVGHLVYIHQGHKHDGDDLGTIADDVSCDGLHFKELAKKARAAIKSAKFGLRLACSPKYICYEGVWTSVKESPNQFKEDLRYLLTLLGRGGLKPNVNECISLLEIEEVQDRIELLGKKGTIVCLPKSATPLYEKKAHHVTSPINSPRRDQLGFPVENDFDHLSYSDDHDDPVIQYASDAGYVKASQPCDALSDFHCMHDTKKNMRATNDKMYLPALPEATSYSQTNFPTTSLQNNISPISSISKYPDSQPQEYYYNDASSVISSGQSIPSTSRTALSDGALKTPMPFMKEDPPLSIQFRNKKESRRYRAYQRQKKARDTWNRSQQKKKMNEKEKESGDEPDAALPMEKPVAAHQIASPRQLRRGVRKKSHTANSANAAIIASPSSTETEKTEQICAASVSLIQDQPESISGQVSVASSNTMEEKSGSVAVVNLDTTSSGALKMGRTRAVPAKEVVDSQAGRNVDRIKALQRSHDVQRALSKYNSRGLQSDKMEIKDSRHEDESPRDTPLNGSSFNTLMHKWKQIEDLNHQDTF